MVFALSAKALGSSTSLFDIGTFGIGQKSSIIIAAVLCTTNHMNTKYMYVYHILMVQVAHDLSFPFSFSS